MAKLLHIFAVIITLFIVTHVSFRVPALLRCFKLPSFNRKGFHTEKVHHLQINRWLKPTTPLHMSDSGGNSMDSLISQIDDRIVFQKYHLPLSACVEFLDRWARNYAKSNEFLSVERLQNGIMMHLFDKDKLQIIADIHEKPQILTRDLIIQQKYIKDDKRALEPHKNRLHALYNDDRSKVLASIVFSDLQMYIEAIMNKDSVPAMSAATDEVNHGEIINQSQMKDASTPNQDHISKEQEYAKQIYDQLSAMDEKGRSFDLQNTTLQGLEFDFDDISKAAGSNLDLSQLETFAREGEIMFPGQEAPEPEPVVQQTNPTEEDEKLKAEIVKQIKSQVNSIQGFEENVDVDYTKFISVQDSNSEKFKEFQNILAERQKGAKMEDLSSLLHEDNLNTSIESEIISQQAKHEENSADLQSPLLFTIGNNNTSPLTYGQMTDIRNALEQDSIKRRLHNREHRRRTGENADIFCLDNEGLAAMNSSAFPRRNSTDAFQMNKNDGDDDEGMDENFKRLRDSIKSIPFSQSSSKGDTSTTTIVKDNRPLLPGDQLISENAINEYVVGELKKCADKSKNGQIAIFNMIQEVNNASAEVQIPYSAKELFLNGSQSASDIAMYLLSRQRSDSEDLINMNKSLSEMTTPEYLEFSRKEMLSEGIRQRAHEAAMEKLQAICFRYFQHQRVRTINKQMVLKENNYSRSALANYALDELDPFDMNDPLDRELSRLDRIDIPNIETFQTNVKQLAILVEELRNNGPMRFEIILNSYADLMLSENIVLLLRIANETCENMEIRKNYLSVIARRSAELHHELLAVMQVEFEKNMMLFQNICDIAFHHQHDEMVFLTKMEKLKDKMDVNFLHFLQFAMQQELMRIGYFDKEKDKMNLSPTLGSSLLTTAYEKAESMETVLEKAMRNPQALFKDDDQISKDVSKEPEVDGKTAYFQLGEQSRRLAESMILGNIGTNNQFRDLSSKELQNVTSLHFQALRFVYHAVLGEYSYRFESLLDQVTTVFRFDDSLMRHELLAAFAKRNAAVDLMHLRQLFLNLASSILARYSKGDSQMITEDWFQKALQIRADTEKFLSLEYIHSRMMEHDETCREDNMYVQSTRHDIKELELALPPNMEIVEFPSKNFKNAHYYVRSKDRNVDMTGVVKDLKETVEENKESVQIDDMPESDIYSQLYQ